MLETPGAFIGEFDALDGPKVTYAFEYFDYERISKGSSKVHQLLSYVEGEILLGKSVASGLLHRECREYLNSVAAHVLTSNESREERVLYQDSGCPCVGSFLFSIPDIVARGEKRRFCLIFLHPSYHELVARWDFLSSFVEVVLGRWTHRATLRYQNEYDTLKNLEQLREESRRKPLRTLPQLLTDVSMDSTSCCPTEPAASAIFEDFHCSFEALLPQVFSRCVPLCCSAKGAAHQEAERILDEQMLLAQASIDHIDVDLPNLPADDVVLPRFAKQVLLLDSQVVVRPLPVWLLEYLADGAADGAGDQSQQAVHTLFIALFGGNQIVISGDNARDCASLGMALSYMVPPPLVKMHLGSERYRMPYESRVLTFSQRALAGYAFADSPAVVAGAGASRTIKLFDMEADGIVHVRLADGRIHAIHDCDALRRAARVEGREGDEVRLKPFLPTTLEKRLMTLLQPHLIPVADTCAISVVALQLLTTQFHQLVSEYVVRGRVYLRLFAKQEVETNSLSLSPEGGGSEAGQSSAAASVGGSSARSQRGVSMRNLSNGYSRLEDAAQMPSQGGLRRGDASVRRSNGASASDAVSLLHSADTTRITKSANLSPAYGKQFQNYHYVFSSFASEDHSILVFLGSA